MSMRSLLPVLATLCLWAPEAAAQSTIYGLDVRLQRFFTTDTGDFVGNFTTIGPNANPIFAIDFDQNGAVLWGVNNTTLEYGTFDLSTGVFSALGTVAGIPGASGLTCDVNGTWYLSAVGVGSQLYVGDVTTGTFALVGTINPGLIIDISIDSQGNLYGNNISDDALYSIDPTTGAGTLIGPTGHATNFAQGMDFDWSTDTLYATLYTGGGTGVFAAMDLATGAGNVIQSTTSLNSEMEIAIPSAAGSVATAYCFGDGSGTPCPCGNAGGAGEGCANGSGSGATLSATGSNVAANDDLVFTGSNLIPSSPALLFVGDVQVNGGAGIHFGDGLRCAGDNVVRLGVMLPNVSGEATWGPGLGGGMWSAGDTRRFQVWYRDPNSSPCGTLFNLTNGLEVTFQ